MKKVIIFNLTILIICLVTAIAFYLRYQHIKTMLPTESDIEIAINKINETYNIDQLRESNLDILRANVHAYKALDKFAGAIIALLVMAIGLIIFNTAYIIKLNKKVKTT